MDFFSKDYREILVQYQEKHIVYLVQQGLIRYRNVIAPRDGGINFPEGYFDVKTQKLSEDEKQQVNFILEKAFSNLLFLGALDTLPLEASAEHVIICTKTTGARVCYSNRISDKSEHSVCAESISPTFLELFHVLSGFCDFMICPAPITSEACIDDVQPQDQRYFEETLWLCKKCSAGNLMEHRYCVKCGAARPW